VLLRYSGTERGAIANRRPDSAVLERHTQKICDAIKSKWGREGESITQPLTSSAN